MLFNSFPFLFFFPLVVGLNFLLPARWRWLHQLVASYVFYMWWEPAYALLILASTLVDWWAALRMPAASRRTRDALLGLSLTVNLGLLFSFKYYNFVNENFRTLVGWGGVDWPLTEASFLLPVGISFYTFQTLSYTIDVWRGQQTPEHHLGRFALYVSFWPQLVAGPIERAGRLLPQLGMTAEWDSDRIVAGVRRMLWGLFKKVVIADRLAPICNAIYAEPESYGGWAVVLGTVVFAYQVWCDFSGYSDVAIGAAKCLGIDLMENFDQPHLSTSIRDYWRRWHISLSTWFRDYLYIPLGGSRVSRLRHGLNLVIVFTISGLWHGAGWGFVLWGLAHGVILTIAAWTRAARTRLGHRLGLPRVPALVRAVRVPITFALVCLTYSFLRSEGAFHWWRLAQRLPHGWEQLGDPAALTSFAETVAPSTTWLLLVLAACPMMEVLQYIRRDERLYQPLNRLPYMFRVWWDLVLVFGILVLGELTTPQEFFYFQF